MKEIFTATKTVFAKQNYFWLFLLFIPTTFFFFVFIPVKTIPGNDLIFQLAALAWRDYFLLLLLSILASLLLIMNIYVFRQRRTLGEVGKGTLVGTTSAVASIFGTATCAACVAAIFGFLGVPAVLFLLSIRFWLVGAAVVFLAVLLYFVAKNVNKVCQDCLLKGNGKI